MRRVLLAILLALLAASASAQRPSTTNMSCGQANALVRSQGSVVLSTGRHTFDRFTAVPGSCPRGERARTGRAPTLDDAQCRLAYVCKPVFRDKKAF
jgi:hypothetical protein